MLVSTYILTECSRVIIEVESLADFLGDYNSLIVKGEKKLS